jgi:hypothetical protein
VFKMMITGSKGDVSWTTRFGIAGADGKLTTEPESKQPSGDAIPWGNGKLASGSGAAAAVSSAAPASSSVVVAVESTNPTAAAVSSAVASAASSAASTPVAQAAASADSTSGASITKPVLTLVSAAIAGYFAF